MNLDEKILRIMSNTEIISEKKAENKDLTAEVLTALQQQNERLHLVQIPGSEDYVEVRVATRRSKVLDKAGLARQADVDPGELTLLGISELTKKGTITPDMIRDNTTNQSEEKAKIKRKTPKKPKGGR